MSVRQTGPERAADHFMRTVYFVSGAVVTPAALYGFFGQGQPAALVAFAGGIALLGLWWLLRPRRLSADARRWQSACSALTLVVIAAVPLAIVQFLQSLSYNGSLTSLWPWIVTGPVALGLLVIRVLAERRLRALVTRDAAQPMVVARPGSDRVAEREIRAVSRQVRSGAYPSSPSLVTDPEGVVTMRPDPHRLRWQPSLIALPFALVLSVRLVLGLGWIGVAIIAGTVGFGLAVGQLIHRLQLWHGFARLTSTTVSVRPWYGRLRSVPRAAVSRVVLVTANLGTSLGRDYFADLMLFLDRDGRCVLHAHCMGVPVSDRRAFAAAVDVPIDAPSETPGPDDLRKLYPGSISWYWSHQVLVSLATAVVVIALVIGGVIGVAAVTGQFSTPPPAHLGQTRSISGVVDVTVLAVDDPAQIVATPSLVQAGTRLVGVNVRIHNTGSTALDAPRATVEVMDSNQNWDDTLGTATSPGEGPTDVDVVPGRTDTAYVVVRVPDGARVVKIEYQYVSPTSGKTLGTLDWVAPTTPSPTASVG